MTVIDCSKRELVIVETMNNKHTFRLGAFEKLGFDTELGTFIASKAKRSGVRSGIVLFPTLDLRKRPSSSSIGGGFGDLKKCGGMFSDLSLGARRGEDVNLADGWKGVLIPVAAEKSSKSSCMAVSKSNSQSVRLLKGEGVSSSGCFLGGVALGLWEGESDCLS